MFFCLIANQLENFGSVGPSDGNNNNVPGYENFETGATSRR